MERADQSRIVAAAWAAFPDRATSLLRELSLSRSDARAPLPAETCLLCGEPRMAHDLARPWGVRTTVPEPLCLGCLGLAARAADDERRPPIDAVLADLVRALTAAHAEEVIAPLTAILAAPGAPTCFVCGLRHDRPPIIRGARPVCAECIEHFRRDRSCPCCGYATLPGRGAFAICPVCFWEDDGQDDEEADDVRGGPNGRLSLTEARRNFARIAACDERSLSHVRRPGPHDPRLRAWVVRERGVVVRVPLE